MVREKPIQGDIMADKPSEQLHEVRITALKNDAAKDKVIEALARVTKNLPEERVRARLDALPWTITRRASAIKAYRLVRLLERLGATVAVDPPLAAMPMVGAAETEILPETKLLTPTEAAPTVRYLSVPADRPADRPPPVPLTPRPAFGQIPRPSAESERAESLSGDGERFPLEPLGLGGILDRTFQICRDYFWKLIAIVAISWLFSLIVFVVVALGGALGFGAAALAASRGQIPWTLIVLGLTVIPTLGVLVMAAYQLSTGALIHAVSSIYLGREIVIGEAVRFVMGKLVRLVLTSILFTLVVLGCAIPVFLAGGVPFLFLGVSVESVLLATFGTLLFAAVPFYVFPKWLLFDKVVIIEDGAYVEALRRSWDLMTGKASGEWPKGYWIRLVILLHLFMFIYLAIYTLFQLPAQMVSLVAHGSPWLLIVLTILFQILSQIGSLIATLFGSVCMVVFYYDIRIRKEGFDLEMLLRSVG